jgi:hypothetical protein
VSFIHIERAPAKFDNSGDTFWARPGNATIIYTTEAGTQILKGVFQAKVACQLAWVHREGSGISVPIRREELWHSYGTDL